MPLVADEVRSDLERGVPEEALCRGLLAAAAIREGSEENEENEEDRLLLGVDAVCRLLPYASVTERRRAFLATAVALDASATRSFPVHLLTRAPLLTEGAIYTGALDEVIEAATVEEAGSRYARLVTVIQDPEYLDELWLEAAVRSAPRTFLTVEVAIRAARGQRWVDAAPFCWRALESLRRNRPARRTDSTGWPPAPAEMQAAMENHAIRAALLRASPRIRRLRSHVSRALGAWARHLDPPRDAQRGAGSGEADANRLVAHLALRTIESQGFDEVRRLVDRIEVER